MNIIEVTNLSKYFYPTKGRRKGKIENNLKQKKKDIVRAVDNISFSVNQGICAVLFLIGATLIIFNYVNYSKRREIKKVV